jgi:hypothetical protein
MGKYELVTFLVVMMVINVGLALYDGAIKEVNPSFDDKNYNINFSSTPASAYIGSDSLGTGTLSNDTSTVFYDSADSVDVTTGQTFTDQWKTTNKFLLIAQTGWGLVSSILVQPAGFMISMGIPSLYAVSFQIIWYIITILLLIGFRKGGT